MTEEFVLQKRDVSVDIKLVIEDVPYTDNITKVAPIILSPGDTFTVTCCSKILGRVDGVVTSTYEQKYSYTFDNFVENINVEYIRFTKFLDKACIAFSDIMPNKLHKPMWNAKLNEN